MLRAPRSVWLLDFRARASHAWAMSDDAEFNSVLELLARDGPVNEAYVAREAAAAARAGLNKAALLAAAVAGVGFGCEKDFAAAIAWLALAAERGDADARAQLQLLAGAETARDWRALADRIDVSAWIAPRPTRIVVDAPRIGVCDGFLDKRTCGWLIKRAAPLQRQSLVYDPYTGKPAPNDARSNSVGSFAIGDLDLVTILVRERIAATMGVPVAHLERVSVFRYLVGQTFADHYDYLEPSPQLNAEIARRGQRPLTFLVYLNDGFEGGETHFIKLDKKFRGGVGDALFFYNLDEAGAPDARTEHAGAPPSSGEKWLLSQFVRDKDQLPG